MLLGTDTVRNVRWHVRRFWFGNWIMVQLGQVEKGNSAFSQGFGPAIALLHRVLGCAFSQSVGVCVCVWRCARLFLELGLTLCRFDTPYLVQVIV